MSTNTIPSRPNSPAFVAGMALLCAAALAAILTAVLMTFGGHDSANAHPHPVASVAQTQRELAQLHYYDGVASGVMNHSTVQAIEYLQRDAHLPQTGQLNAATQAALANFIVHGNNQMGS